MKLRAGAVLGLLALLAASCGAASTAVPACQAGPRLGIVAQSVPGAAYLPCLQDLAQGWRAMGFDPASGHTRFALLSDRAQGRTVIVELTGGCDVSGAVPTTPRGEGIRTYLRLRSISPRYAGTLEDVFPGGCVTYQFDFQRGPHIALIEQFKGQVGLYARSQLRLELGRQLGVDIGP